MHFRFDKRMIYERCHFLVTLVEESKGFRVIPWVAGEIGKEIAFFIVLVDIKQVPYNLKNKGISNVKLYKRCYDGRNDSTASFREVGAQKNDEQIHGRIRIRFCSRRERGVHSHAATSCKESMIMSGNENDLTMSDNTVSHYKNNNWPHVVILYAPFFLACPP